MKIDTNTHLINNVPFYESDNCDKRPIGIEVDTIIIHCISLPEGKYANNNILKVFEYKVILLSTYTLHKRPFYSMTI